MRGMISIVARVTLESPSYKSRLTATSSPDGSDSFTYDAAGQVTAATHSYQANEAYSYDANGNRTNAGYTTGTGNQLTSDGTYNYVYDAAGNLTKKTTISSGVYVTYTWDYHNRLTDLSSCTSAGVLTQHPTGTLICQVLHTSDLYLVTQFRSPSISSGEP